MYRRQKDDCVDSVQSVSVTTTASVDNTPNLKVNED
jgi:hypothetical protein